MEKINLLIVDDNPEFVELVKEAVEQDEAIHVAGTAYNGNEAIETVRLVQPDVMLLDVVMPEKDGLEVLEEIGRMEGRRPSIIMLTAIGQDHYIRRALALGAEYYMMKPFDMQLLLKRIHLIYDDARTNVDAGVPLTRSEARRSSGSVNREDVERETINALNDISVPPNLSGYLYLKKGIIATVLSERGYLPATKELYPLIAEEFVTTTGKIERAIRGAIHKAWVRKEQSQASNYFAYAGNYKSIKPTNSEFIATVAAKIRQKLSIDN